EDLAVSDLAGSGSLQDRVHHVIHLVVVGQDLHLDLGHEVHLVLRAAIDLRVPPLAPEALHVRRGEPVHADGPERLLHLVQPVRLDDGHDELHSAPPGASAGSPAWSPAASRVISVASRTGECTTDPPRSDQLYPTSRCSDRSSPASSSSPLTRRPTSQSDAFRIPKVIT